MKGIYKFFWDCHRAGYVEGTFIATKEEVDNAIGKSVYFGEILGKHSEVYGTIDKGEITLVSDDQDFVAKCEEVFTAHISGYNPLDYIEEEEE